MEEKTTTKPIKQENDPQSSPKAKTKAFGKRGFLFLRMLLYFAVLLVGLYAFYKYFFANSDKVDTSLIPVLDNSSKWGFINQKGTYVINPQFTDCSPFFDGLATVMTTGGKVGYIDKKGKFVIQPQYKDGTDFHEGLAFVVTEGGFPECINKKGQTVFSLKEAKEVRGFSEGLACFMTDNGKCGYVNTKGKIVIAAQFDGAADFSEGMAAVCNADGKFGFINKKGKIVINHQFEDTESFSEGLAAFDNGDMVGFVNKKGKYVINPQFEDASSFSEGMALIDNGDMIGFIDKKGKFVVNPQFEDADVFHGGLAAVSSGDRYGYINKKGQFAINPQFDDAHPFVGKIASVCSAGKWGLINKKGEYVVNPQFVRIMLDGEINNRTIASDYYDTKPFIDAFFTNWTKNNIDGFTSKSTLNDIINHSVYGDLANTSGSRDVLCQFQSIKAITDDIGMLYVYFGFDKDVYEYDYDHFDYDSYSYEKEYKLSTPIKRFEYAFYFDDEAAEKEDLLEKAVINKLSSIFNINFTKDGDDFWYKGNDGNFFFIVGDFNEMGGAGLNIYIFTDQQAYEEALKKLPLNGRI